jgi:hypothetical protein
MRSSEARVQTDVPRRYLGQLCKHCQHKLPVTLEETRGRIEFAGGVCEVGASLDDGVLLLRVTAPDEDGLARLEDVVARHLERFAFREELRVAWQRTG